MEVKITFKVILVSAFLGILGLAWTGTAYAQTGKPAGASKPAGAPKPPGASKSAGDEELPLNITADRLEADQNQQVITFINKVVARYKDMILYSDLLKIFYETKKEPPGSKRAGAKSPENCQDSSPTAAPAKSKTGQPGTGGSPMDAVGIEKITRIEALGKVRIVEGDRVATGDKAIYYTQEDKIVLLGNPQLWQGENSVKGREIIFYHQENRAVVEGEINKRVEAVLYPSQKTQLPGKQTTPSPQK
jgi:lipopolysaccharide export system protein LptA